MGIEMDLFFCVGVENDLVLVFGSKLNTNSLFGASNLT